jgi:hypothetical protein
MPVLLERPSDVVARLARQALTAPGDTAAWKALAGALPAMALTGGADLEGTFEAARVADSVSVAAGGGIAPRSASVFASLEYAPIAGVMVFLGALAALAVHLLRGRRHLGNRALPGTLSEAGRLWTATTLAAGGLALPEISKRTGLAQEAVNLALLMAAQGPMTNVVEPVRTPMALSSGVPFGRTAAEEQLRREVVAGSGRLKDRRLTYGGGRG